MDRIAPATPGAARSCVRTAAALAAVLAFAAAPAAPALGQEPARDTVPDPVPDSVRYRMEGLTVEATRPALEGGGASAVEMTMDSVEAVPSPTLSELLRQMPLIRVRRNSRGQVQPSLRGMEERQIAVLVDGVPLTLGWDNRTDLSVVPLASARRIRMVRGLSSVLAGPNVLGGVVKVDVGQGGIPDTVSERYRASSSRDHTGATTLSLELRELWGRPDGDRFFLKTGWGWRDTPGDELPEGVVQPAAAGDRLLNSDREYAQGFVAGRYQAEGGAWLSLSTMAFRAQRGVTPELHLLGGPDPEPRFWRIPEHWRSVTSLSAGTGWGETPFGGRGDLEASVGLDLQHLEIDSFDSPTYTNRVAGEVGEDRTLTLRLLGDHTLGPGTLSGAMTVADTWHEQTLDPGGVQEFRQRLYSFGLEVEQPLAPGDGEVGFLADPRLTAGFSVDGSTTPKTGDKPARDPIWGWGGRLSATALVADGAVKLHGGASRKVRFPALRELFSGALGKFEPNPDLGPLTLVVGELGATAHLGGRFELQGTLFQQRLKGSIVRAVLPGGQFQRQNRGETRATGVELMANWRAGPLTLRGDLTLQDVALLDDQGEELDEKPEYQPEVVGSLGVGAPLPLGLRSRAAVEYTGSQFGANPETGNFVELEPSTWLEAGVSRRVGRGPAGLPGMRLSVTVENLTDEAVFHQLGLPRPGRTLRVQMEVR